MSGIGGVAWRADKDAKSPRSGPLSLRLSTRLCALARTSKPVTCAPTPALSLRRRLPESPVHLGLVLAFKESTHHSGSETKTCSPQNPCAASECSRAPGPLAESGCLGKAREGGPPATDHVCAGTTTRPRVEHRARVTVQLAAQGAVGVAPRPFPASAANEPHSPPRQQAGAKTQEALLRRRLWSEAGLDTRGRRLPQYKYEARAGLAIRDRELSGRERVEARVGCGSSGAPRGLEAAKARHAGRTVAAPWSRPTSTRRSRGPP